MVNKEDGKIKCPKCDGVGYKTKMLLNAVNKRSKFPGIFTCSLCIGHGNLDWVEQIVGKKPYDGVGVEQMRSIGAKIGKPRPVTNSMWTLNHQEECNKLIISIFKSRRF